MLRLLLTLIAAVGFAAAAHGEPTKAELRDACIPAVKDAVQRTLAKSGKYLTLADAAIINACASLVDISTVVAPPQTPAPEPDPVPVPPPPPPVVTPPPANGAGWTQLSTSAIRGVWPAQAQTTWGTIGPDGVLQAWNNIAWDAETSCAYAHGGGHADYGGNEVYRWCLGDKVWTRLTDPSAYPARSFNQADPIEARCPRPLSGPSSTHTYDGKLWSSALKRLLVFTTSIAFCPSGVGERWGDGHIWAFDPASGSWTDIGPSPVGGMVWTVELPNGNIAIGNNTSEAIWNPRANAVIAKQVNYGDEGDGSAVYDPVKNRIVVANYYRISTIQLDASFNFATRRTGLPVTSAHLGGIPYNGSSAIASDGRLIRWGGGRTVIAVNLETGERQAYSFATGPTGTAVLYDRMFPLPDGTLLAIANNGGEGVWRLKIDGPGLPVPTQSLQQQFDSGARTFQAGLYSYGLRIAKGADVDLSGVSVGTAVDGKAAVLVQTAEPVTIRNATLSGMAGNGNTAGIKAEGANFNLTVIGADISNSEMGILTDNKGGRLEIVGSTIHDIGRANADKGHCIYAGEIDTLIVRNSSVLRCGNYGHNIKTRARATTIESNTVAQLGALGSRLVDASAGGTNTIRGNVFEQAANTDNAEMIGLGLELINRQWDEQVTVSEGNTFISDVTNRPHSSIVAPFKCRTSAQADNRGVVTPPHALTSRNDRFIWAGSGELKGNIAIYCPQAVVTGAQEFIGRAAAGLSAYPALQ